MTHLSLLETSSKQVHGGYLFRDFFRVPICHLWLERASNYAKAVTVARLTQLAASARKTVTWRHAREYAKAAAALTAGTRKAAGTEEEIARSTSERCMQAKSQHKLLT